MHLNFIAIGLAALHLVHGMPAEEVQLATPKNCATNHTIEINGGSWEYNCKTYLDGTEYFNNFKVTTYKACFNYCAKTYGLNLEGAQFLPGNAQSRVCTCYTVLTSQESSGTTVAWAGFPPSNGGG